MRNTLLILALLATAGARPTGCRPAGGEPCAREPLEPVAVALDVTTPRYSETFAGTVEAVVRPAGGEPWRIVLRPDAAGGTRTVRLRWPAAGIRLAPGRHVRVQVDHVAGFPSLSGIVVHDERGLLLAAAADQRPGATVLRDGVGGFRIDLGPATCPGREAGECYDAMVNVPLRFAHGGAERELYHGDSAVLGDYRVQCLVSQQVTYSPRCADAGVVGTSWILARRDVLGDATMP